MEDSSISPLLQVFWTVQRWHTEHGGQPHQWDHIKACKAKGETLFVKDHKIVCFDCQHIFQDKMVQLNACLAFFLHDLLSVMDRGYVFTLIRTYMKDLCTRSFDLCVLFWATQSRCAIAHHGNMGFLVLLDVLFAQNSWRRRSKRAGSPLGAADRLP